MVWCHLGLWLSKVLFVQVAVIHLLQNQHFRQTGGNLLHTDIHKGANCSHLCVNGLMTETLLFALDLHIN